MTIKYRLVKYETTKVLKKNMNEFVNNIKLWKSFLRKPWTRNVLQFGVLERRMVQIRYVAPPARCGPAPCNRTVHSSQEKCVIISTS